MARANPAAVRSGGRNAVGRLGLALGFGALAAVCFALGIVSAVLLEEPSLLADRAAGRSVTVPLDEPAAAPSLEAAPRPETKRGAAPSPARPAVGAPHAGHAIQVGAFAERLAAEGLARSLGEEGLPVYLSPSEGPDVRWRVRVGPFASRPEAERAAAGLATRRLPTWILSEQGR